MPERQCDGCKKKDTWGCTAIRLRHPEPGEPDLPRNWLRPAAQPVTVMGETTYACPRQHIHENPRLWAWMLKFYGLYKRGFLPGGGGVLSQSNKALEVFRILDDANDQCDRAEAEKLKKQQARRGPSSQRPKK